MANLSIAVIGPFQVTANEQVVTAFQSNKVRALLAFLAAETEHPHSRETLAGLLWPDYPNPSALTYLRNALANLRQVIGDAQAQPPYLIISRNIIQINPASSLWIDLRAFEELIRPSEDPQAQITNLQAAIALYRGPFLDGFSCDSSAFGEWALTRRERVNRQLRDALSRLAGAYAQRGENDQSIQIARRLLELEPWDEAAHRLVMRGLARSGQRSAALTQYEACRRILQQELGVQPSTETESLVESIRGGKLSPGVDQINKLTKPGFSTQPRLPVPLTTFIGRQNELTEIRSLLCRPPSSDQPSEGKPRLLTLIGAGGCGKTRLAIATAHSLKDAECYQQGVWWVDLTPITDPALVIHTVAAVFGLEESGRTPILQLIINLLHEKNLLLALDNCEHLIEPTARLVQKLLEECPGIQIMVTSRISLGVPGEILWRVPSMAVPHSVDEKADIRDYDAIRLFEERGRTIVPGWSLDENAANVVKICTRLDGIPLAIELAGARLRMMTVEQIAARLDDAFRLLTGGSRNALARHQTLRACIDWSYSLLSIAEGALLRQLSIFQGGWTLEAVEFIGQYEPIPGVQPDEILDVLARLVDRSLVVVQGKGKSMRYRLLDTIRQYTHEKLVEAGEEDAASRRHLAYFLDLAVQAEGQLRGPEQKSWHETVKTELENLRAALVWALKTNPQIELRMASALFWFWRVKKDWMLEGLRWLETGLAADTNHSGEVLTTDSNRALVRGWALNVTTWFQLMLSSYWTEYSRTFERQAADDKRGEYNQEALTLFQGLGKPGRRGWAFALVMKTEQDPQRRKLLLEESFDIFRQEGDKFYMAEDLTHLGEYANRIKDFGSARKFHEQELALRNEIGDWEGVGWAHQELGLVDFMQSNFKDAKQHFVKALDICQMIGHLPEQIWNINTFLCALALAKGENSEAQLYADNLLTIARETGEDWQYSEGIQKKGNALIQEDSHLAGRLLNEALLLFLNSRNESDLAYNLESQANLAFVSSQYERAARLLSASLHWWQLKKFPPELHDPPRQENLRNAIQTALGEQAFAKAWAEGEAMTLDQAAAYALDENAS